MRALPVYEVKRNAPVFLPKYKKLMTFFEKQGVLCICEKRSAAQLSKQIQERAKRHGSEIDRWLAEQLASRCLCDSTLIHTELDKLLACANGEPITEDMLNALTAALPDADAFRLARAVTGGNGNAAFRMLADLTAKSEDSKTILGLLSVISTTFIDLYRAKLGQGAAKQAETIAADFGYPKNREFAVKNAMRDCGAMTVPQLRTCIRILRETDKACKSSRTAPRLLLEQAFVRMLNVRRDGTEMTA
jgi:DNA polymerase-3 subunit delta